MLLVPEGSIQTKKHKAIFFDAGDTLFKINPSIGVLYAQEAVRFGAVFDAQRVEDIFQDEWKQRAQNGQMAQNRSIQAERVWWHDFVFAIVNRLGGMALFEEYFEHLFAFFASDQPWRLFPEVWTVLEECRRRGLRLGIVSNWDTRLLQICEKLKLSPQMHFILVSGVVGVAKPDPAIFRLALEQAGVDPAEAIHVGDSLQDDIQGAKAAGVDSLWINRYGYDPVPGIAMTDSLLGVLELC